MLNEVLIEGIVTRGGWEFNNVRFIRLAVYRDAELPRKPRAGNANQDEPDFLTLRCEGTLGLAADSLNVGDLIIAAGAIVTRDYEVPLQRFVTDAQGPDKARPASAALAALRPVAAAHGRDLLLYSTLTEIHVARLQLRAQAADPPAPAIERQARRRNGTGADRRPAAPDLPASRLPAGPPAEIKPQLVAPAALPAGELAAAG